MIVLLFHSLAVGPICQRIASYAENLTAVRDTRYVPNMPDHLLFRWDSRLSFPGDATPEINSLASVLLSRNKRESRKLLGELGPKTWFSPDEIVCPCVIRPCHHYAGRNFYVCRTPREVGRAILRCGPSWYASELIDKVQEFRVFVLQGRIVRISERTKPQDPHIVPWNLAAGGGSRGVGRIHWPIPVARAALMATERLRCTWGAVDVMVDGRGLYVLEINTAPGLSKPQALATIAKAVASCERPDIALGGGQGESWRDLLHPALRT